MFNDRRIMWVLILILLVIVLAWALDHVFFPDLPVPAGVAPIAK